MSDDAAIIAHFGGDVSDLKDATDQAAIMMKGFSSSASRAVREIGEGFVGAVVFEKAIEGFREMASAAMDAAEQERIASSLTGEAISEQSQAWLDLKDGIGGAKSGVMGFITSLLSGIPETGDAIGSLLLRFEGIGPTAEAQYTQIANTTQTTLATIKAAHDKYLADLPAAEAATNAKILAVDQQLAQSQMSTQEKIVEKLQEIADTKAFMLQQDPTSLAYAQNELKVKQDELDVTKLQAEQDRQDAAELQKLHEMVLEADREDVAQQNAALKTRAESQTIEEQIVDLKQQQAKFAAMAALSVNDEKQAKIYANAAAQAGVEIADKERTIRQAVALSTQDQLNLFIATTPALQNLNTLSEAQLQLLKNQSAEKQNQYQIDELLAKGADQRTQAENDLLTTLIKQTNQLQQQDGILKQIDADTPKPKATGGGRSGGGSGGGLKSLGADATLNADGTWDDPTSDNAALAAAMSGNRIYIGTDPSFGNNALQESLSAANAKANLQSMIDSLQSQIMQDQHSADPAQEALIPALQAKIDALHQQMIQISPSNPNGTAPTGYQAPDTSKQLTTLNDTLTTLTNHVMSVLPTNG